MCDPVSITLAAVNATAAVAGHVGQQRTANATFKAASQAATDDAYALADRRGEESRARSDKMSARAREGERQMGLVTSMLGDAGFSGNTADRLRTEVAANTAEDLTTLARDENATGTQLSREEAASRARAQSIVNQTPRPSLLGTGLQIAGAGLDAYSRNKAAALRSGGR